MIEPGQTCGGCGRRMPHPRKQSSPDTVVFSYRVPVDEAPGHRGTREAAARFLDVFERPHWQFWATTFGDAAVLQDESMRGVGQRSVIA